MKIILASTSRRKKEILEKIGLKFVTEESGFEEKTNLQNPQQIVKYFSKQKAKGVVAKHPKDLIIAADTIVVFNKKIMGKPKNYKEARKMLSILSGKTHLVMTGVTLMNSKKSITKVSKTKVKFKKLTEKEIDAYLKTGDFLGNAGAYAIQGKAGIFIEKIDGEYFNIIGFPVNLLANILIKFKVSIDSFWR